MFDLSQRSSKEIWTIYHFHFWHKINFRKLSRNVKSLFFLLLHISEVMLNHTVLKFSLWCHSPHWYLHRQVSVSPSNTTLRPECLCNQSWKAVQQSWIALKDVTIWRLSICPLPVFNSRKLHLKIKKTPKGCSCQTKWFWRAFHFKTAYRYFIAGVKDREHKGQEKYLFHLTIKEI